MWVHSLHEKYGPIPPPPRSSSFNTGFLTQSTDRSNFSGPVVRISPDQVFVSDPRDVHQIHRIKGEYLKAPFYEKIVPGIVNVFNATSVDAHRRYRKLLSGPISETGLQVLLPQVDTKVRLAVHRISEEMYTRGAADISKWWMFMTTDVIGELSFGESFRMLEYGEVRTMTWSLILSPLRPLMPEWCVEKPVYPRFGKCREEPTLAGRLPDPAVHIALPPTAYH